MARSQVDLIAETQNERTICPLINSDDPRMLQPHSTFVNQPHSTIVNATTDNGTIVFGNVIYEGQQPPPQLIDWEAIAGEPVEVERQITEVLQMENTENPDLIGALQTLIQLSEDFTTPKPNIIQLLFRVMDLHPKDLQIQTLSLEAIYSLTSHLSSSFYNIIREEIVNKTLVTTENFPLDQVISHYSAVIINDLWQCFQRRKIDSLKGVSFAMRVLCNFSDRSVQIPCLQLLSKLANIPGSHISIIGMNLKFWEKIHHVLEEKYKADTADEELIMCLDVVKILSYEVPTRYRIIFGSKLDLIIQLVDRFPKENVLSKALAIIEQVSRQEEGVRLVAMKPFIKSLLLYTRHEKMEVSYLSSAVLFNISRNEEVSLLFDEDLRRKIHSSIESSVYRWGPVNQSDLVKHNSLEMLIEALKSNFQSSLQLFSAWTLHYLWNEKPDYYSSILKRENLVEDLRSCQLLQDGCEEGKMYLNTVLQLVNEQKKTSWERVDPKSLQKIRNALDNPNVTKDEVIKLHESLRSYLGPTVAPKLDQILSHIFPKHPKLVTFISKLAQQILNSNSSFMPGLTFTKSLLYILSITLTGTKKDYFNLLKLMRSIYLETAFPDELNAKNGLFFMTETIATADKKKNDVLNELEIMQEWFNFMAELMEQVIETSEQEVIL